MTNCPLSGRGQGHETSIFWGPGHFGADETTYFKFGMQIDGNEYYHICMVKLCSIEAYYGSCDLLKFEGK